MRPRARLMPLLLILAVALCACQPLVEEDFAETQVLYATCYPLYALTEALIQGVPEMELHCLIAPQDGCIRSYSLSDWDLYLLAYGADAVIAGGRGLESFESTLYALGDQGPAVVAALYNLELYNQDEEAAAAEDASHLTGANPHLYLSADGAARICEALAFYMTQLDPDYADIYSQNLEVVLERLEALAAEISQIAAGWEGSPVALMHEALIYPAREMGLEVACWIDRESGTDLYESELSACLEELSQSGARVVLLEKQAPLHLVDALSEAGYAVARLDVLSTLREDMGSQAYFDALLENARAVAAAFERAEGTN